MFVDVQVLLNMIKDIKHDQTEGVPNKKTFGHQTVFDCFGSQTFFPLDRAVALSKLRDWPK